jgi:membrane fusion protein, peptide pheromone/bacteriocin exporter
MPVPIKNLADDPGLKNSIAVLLQDPSTYTHLVYLLILGFLAFAFLGMAVVQVPVFVRANGIIRSEAGVSTITAPVSGIISNVNACENERIRKGKALFSFDFRKEKTQEKLTREELVNTDLKISDLEVILHEIPAASDLRTEKYRYDYVSFREKESELSHRLELAEADHSRISRLYSANYVSLKEFENSGSSLNSLKTEKDLLRSEKMRSWANELTDLKTLRNNLSRQLSEIAYLLLRSDILSPSTGTVQGIRNRFAGEFVTAGTELCKLIPDTSLIAEIYVSPRDIGFIRPGMKVKLLIDSYDYRYWGMLNAVCESISDDAVINGESISFLVTCRLNPDASLQYSGMSVNPGKGMTFTARFLVSEKNMWQLINDNMYKIIASEPQFKSK